MMMKLTTKAVFLMVVIVEDLMLIHNCVHYVSVMTEACLFDGGDCCDPNIIIVKG